MTQNLYYSVRYGLPFLGDNSFMIDVLQEVGERQPAYWYERIPEHDDHGPHLRTTRLTISIDRQNLAKTTGALFFPQPEPTLAIPESAWVTIPA